MKRFFPNKSSPGLLDGEGEKKSNNNSNSKPVESKPGMRMVVSSGDLPSDLPVCL